MPKVGQAVHRCPKAEVLTGLRFPACRLASWSIEVKKCGILMKILLFGANIPSQEE
jgi:hypothetical protein